LADYLGQALPAPPTSTNYWDKAASALSQVYLNDAESDCVIAMMMHIDDVLLANAGEAPIIFSETQINLLYGAIGGYVVGDPSTDNGCEELAALNYWQQHGLLTDGSHKIAGWASVNGSNQVEVASAQWLFENLVFGMGLPDAWIDPAPSGSGFTWDLAGPCNPNNGHAVCGVDIDPAGIVIDTWGMRGILTWRAIAAYATPANGGECHVVFSHDAISRATQKAASGFSAASLQYDLTVFK
jgi:hypothetical protein